MSEKYDSLVKECPLLYADRYKSMRETAMCWGFSVGEGWFEIIKDLSHKLEPLIAKYIEDNPDELRPPRALQVKEKFGGLRFYINCGTDEMYDLITEAESKTYKTCEVCGKPGKVRGEGWIKVRCDNCTGDNL